MDPPKIVTDPQDILNVIPGHNVTFSVIVAGLRLVYTWEQGDGSARPSDNRFVIKEESLTIQNVMILDPNSYRCVVSNAAGSVNSSFATFTMSEWLHSTVPITVLQSFPGHDMTV